MLQISQDTYQINGGELYAKQLFGALQTPNYWNLYEVLEDLLSDGRFVNYGGILLAEYYKGYDTIALSGAGAGGGYVTSDGDYYQADTTHTWHDDTDGKGNRWIAYLFDGDYHDFNITDTDTSPRSIFIGRKVGTINCIVNTRISQVVVPDGNELTGISSGGTATSQWDKKIVIRNLQNANHVLYNTTSESIYIQAVYGENLIEDSGASVKHMSVILDITQKSISPTYNLIGGASSNTLGKIYIDYLCINGIETIHDVANTTSLVRSFSSNDAVVFNGLTTVTNMPGGLIRQCALKKLFLPDLEEYAANSALFACKNCVCEYIFVGYKTNDSTKSVVFKRYAMDSQKVASLVDIELQSGYCKNINVSDLTESLTEANMYAHILQKLKQDEADCGDGITITLGATNLAKLTSQESIDLLDVLTNTYGYTFA